MKVSALADASPKSASSKKKRPGREKLLQKQQPFFLLSLSFRGGEAESACPKREQARGIIAANTMAQLKASCPANLSQRRWGRRGKNKEITSEGCCCHITYPPSLPFLLFLLTTLRADLIIITGVCALCVCNTRRADEWTAGCCMHCVASYHSCYVYLCSYLTKSHVKNMYVFVFSCM